MVTTQFISTLIVDGLNFPEGPAFDQQGNLWLVELNGGNLVKVNGTNIERFQTQGNPNGVAIDSTGKVWFCDAGQKSIRTFDPATAEFETQANAIDHERLDKPNDLAFDAAGNLVFTCPGESRKDATGYACVLSREGCIKKITDQKYFPNGLAFTNDGISLIIAETYKHRLWKGEWDSDKAEWKNPKIWCDIAGPDGPGGPDGMAFDANGVLYVAVYGTGTIQLVSDEGKVIQVLEVPGNYPTNCAFGPSGNLVITEAENGILINAELKVAGGKLFHP